MPEQTKVLLNYLDYYQYFELVTELQKTMDQGELKQILAQKKQNPRLKRIPLNLGTKFISFQNNSQVQVSQVLTQYNALLLLFGAGSCNITKPFIAELKKHYAEINLDKKNIEIVFVSFDKIRKDFDGVTEGMPWIGVNFEDPRVKDLKQFYNVRAIPELVLVSNQGQIVSKNCRSDIYNLKEDQAFEKWIKLKEEFNLQ